MEEVSSAGKELAVVSRPRVYVRPLRGKRAHDDPAFAVPVECIVNVSATGRDPFGPGLSPTFAGPCTLPFSLPGADSSIPAVSRTVENAWKFSMIRESQTTPDGEPSDAWTKWASDGFASDEAEIRSTGLDERCMYFFGGSADTVESTATDGYAESADASSSSVSSTGVSTTLARRCVRWRCAEARRNLYAPLYAKAVERCNAFAKLRDLLAEHGEVTLLDINGWDNESYGVHLEDVFYCESKEMGHSFILAMLLLGKRPWKEPFLGKEKIVEVSAIFGSAEAEMKRAASARAVEIQRVNRAKRLGEITEIEPIPDWPGEKTKDGVL